MGTGQDQTIQLMSKNHQSIDYIHSYDLCFYKKNAGYNNGDYVYVVPCGDMENLDPEEAGKYQFRYDSESGRITSIGSESTKAYCLRIANPEIKYEQKARIAPCNPNDKNQKFDLQDGKIYSRENHRVCLGFHFSDLVTNAYNNIFEAHLVFTTCYSNAWAVSDEHFRN